jgi:hypothetical protein
LAPPIAADCTLQLGVVEFQSIGISDRTVRRAPCAAIRKLSPGTRGIVLLLLYLQGCAREVHPQEQLSAKIERADWKQLLKLFRDLRGTEQEAFPRLEALDTLQHLGNACRHGEGAAAVELSRRPPDLWRPIPPLPSGDLPSDVNRQLVGAMDISVDRLHGFVDAIVAFWRDAEYCNSCGTSHEQNANVCGPTSVDYTG